MATRLRRQTRAQGDRDIIRYQQALSGGMNADQAPSLLPAGEMAEIVNMRTSGSRLMALQDSIAWIPENLRSKVGQGQVITQMGHITKYGTCTTNQVTTLTNHLLWALEVGTNAVQGLDIKFRDPGDGGTLGGTGWATTISLLTWMTYAEAVAGNVRVVAYDDGVLVSSPSALVRVIVSEDSVSHTYICTALKVNQAAGYTTVTGPVPNTGAYFNSTSDIPLAYKYFFKVTYGYKATDGTVLWESPAISIYSGTTPQDLAFTTSCPIEDLSTAPSTFTAFVDLDHCNTGTTSINFIRLWRTLNVFDLSVYSDAELLNAQSYRLEHEAVITPTGSLSLTNSNYTFKSDELLVAGGKILSITSSHAPIPTGGPLAYSAGFLYSAKADTLYYSTAGDEPSQIGYYFQGGPCQLKDRGIITAILPSTGYVLVSTLSSIRRISTENTLDVGLGPGIYEPIFQYTPYASESIGIPAEYSDAAVVVNERCIFLSNENHVRIYTGTLLNPPLDLSKVEKLLRPIQGTVVGVYSPEGYYAIWWASDLVDAPEELDQSLRFDFDANGAAVSKQDFGTPIYLKPCYISQAMELEMVNGSTDSWTGILCYVYDADYVAQYSEVGDFGFNVYSQTTYSDQVGDLPWSITTPQYKGEYDGYMVGHRETVLTTQGSFSAGTFEILADATGNESFGYRVAHGESITLTGAQIGATISLTRSVQNLRYCQIKLSGTSSTRFELNKLMSVLTAMDRPYRNGSPVLDYTQDANQRAFMTAQKGYPSNMLSGMTNSMTTRSSTFAGAMSSVFTDGTSRLVNTLTTVSGDYATINVATTDAPASRFGAFVSFWLAGSSLTSSWKNLVAWGTRFTLQGKLNVDATHSFRIYGPTGLLLSLSDVEDLLVAGNYIHICMSAAFGGVDDSIRLAVNKSNLQGESYTPVDAGTLDDIHIGAGFCEIGSDGVITPKQTSVVTVHDLRFGQVDFYSTVIPDDYYDDYINNQGARLTPGTVIR